MKKSSKIWAVCLAVLLMFSLTACVTNVDEPTPLVPINGEAPDPDTVVSEKIPYSDDVLTKIFDYSDVPNATLKKTLTSANSSYEKQETYILADGDKTYNKKTVWRKDSDAEITESYAEKAGDAYYAYMFDKARNKWLKAITDKDTAFHFVDDITKGLSDYSMMLSHAGWEAFVYNDERKAYTLESGDNLIEIKITNGKVSVFRVKYNSSEDLYLVYNVDSTAVTPPADAEIMTE